MSPTVFHLKNTDIIPCSTNDECPLPLFCGTDSTCHDRTCVDFYNYGDSEYTGRGSGEGEVEFLECYINGQDEIPADLEPPCKDGEFPVAIYYWCQTTSWIQNNWCPEGYVEELGESITDAARLNRVCTAKPDKDHHFICYDMVPGNDTATILTEYHTSMIERFSSCPDGDLTMEYSLLKVDGKTDDSLNLAFNPTELSRWNNTMIFDPILAGGLTIQTLLIEMGGSPPDDDDDTNNTSTTAPTSTPSMGPPPTNPSDASTTSSRGLMMMTPTMVAFSMVFLLSFFM